MATDRTLGELRDDPAVKDYLKKLEEAEKAVDQEIKTSAPGPEEQQRADILEKSVDYLIQVREEWSKSDSDALSPTDKFWQVAEDVMSMFSDGMIPSGCRRLAEMVVTMVQPWESFVVKMDRTGADEGMPESEFWRSLDTIQNYRKSVSIMRPNSLEPIAVLVAQGVSERQICIMYGDPFCISHEMPNGTTRHIHNLDVLREEMVTPGKHTGPGTGWISPMEKKARADLDKARKAGKRIIGELREKHRPKSTPETIFELAQQEVCLRQMAEMKDMPIEEIVDQLEAAGMRVPPLTYEPVRVAKAPQEPEMTEDEERILDAQFEKQDKMPKKTPSVEKFIVAQHEGGQSEIEIKRSVREMFDGRSVPVSEIRSVIKKAKWKAENGPERKRQESHLNTPKVIEKRREWAKKNQEKAKAVAQVKARELLDEQLDAKHEEEVEADKKRILSPKPLPGDESPMTFPPPVESDVDGQEEEKAETANI